MRPQNIQFVTNNAMVSPGFMEMTQVTRSSWYCPVIWLQGSPALNKKEGKSFHIYDQWIKEELTHPILYPT